MFSRTLSTILALSSCLASASIVVGTSHHTSQQRIIAQGWENNMLNVTLNSPEGPVSYYLGKLLAQGGPNIPVWTILRNCKDKNYKIFHENEFGIRNYIQRGDPANVGSASYYDHHLRFESPDSTSGRVFIKTDGGDCLAFDGGGVGRFKSDALCMPFFMNEATKPELSDGMETCS